MFTCEPAQGRSPQIDVWLLRSTSHVIRVYLIDKHVLLISAAFTKCMSCRMAFVHTLHCNTFVFCPSNAAEMWCGDSNLELAYTTTMFKFHRMTTLTDPVKPPRFMNKTAHVHTQSIIHTYTLKSCLFYFNSCAHMCCVLQAQSKTAPVVGPHAPLCCQLWLMVRHGHKSSGELHT